MEPVSGQDNDAITTEVSVVVLGRRIDSANEAESEPIDSEAVENQGMLCVELY